MGNNRRFQQDIENSWSIGRKRDVEFVELPWGITVDRQQDLPVVQFLGSVEIGTILRSLASLLQLPLVVELPSEWENKSFFLASPLHGTHRRIDITVVAVDLLQKVFLSVSKLAESLRHAIHLVLTLDTLPVLATDIASDGIEDPLEPVVSGDLALPFDL